ncbi:hypothetical protein MYX84_11040 [Acidobacteria bacterium AH-259-O06]|nr:hypothetical protein [Acidobacteria bacterium AH-259-O06]
MNRAHEIRELNRLSLEQFMAKAKGRLLVLETLEELHLHFARSIAAVVGSNNAAGRKTVLILPYGPSGQYPLLGDILNKEEISLRNTTLFFMDEYADASGKVLPQCHPLSFQGQITCLWESLDRKLRPVSSNIIFPNQDNSDRLEKMIQADGGVDVCFGGIGIHGHIAFNEPEDGVRHSGPRLVRLNDYTVTMNAIRSHVGGDLENFPRQVWTLGMRQCLSARRIQLYCRNDVDALDWANTVLRLAVLGQPGDDYPVTWIREHDNWQVITDRKTASPPQCLL